MSIELVFALITLLIGFGMFILSFINVVIAIVNMHNNNKKK